MKIAVCDDELQMRQQIIAFIRILDEGSEIKEFESGEALLNSKEMFSILFLDIKMEGENGIEIAKQLRKLEITQTEIIFVTGLEEYVFEAFDVQAFNYLMKPLDKVKFLQVFNKAKGRYKNKLQQEKFLDEKGISFKSIVVKNGSEHKKIQICDLYLAEVRNRKTTLYTKDGNIEYYAKLSELEKELGTDFFRCHRAFLISLEHVWQYSASGVTMTNGMEVLMAKQKYSTFVKAYLLYIKRTH